MAALVRRRPGRILGVAAGVAFAVCLLASLGSFFSASLAHMTREAARGVPVDWQVQLATGTDPARAQRAVASDPGVVRTRMVTFADVTHFASSAGGSVQVTGPGQAVGLPPDYATAFPGVLRYLTGARSGVLWPSSFASCGWTPTEHQMFA